MKLNIKGKESAMNLEAQYNELKLFYKFIVTVVLAIAIVVLALTGNLQEAPVTDIIMSAILTFIEAN